MATTAASPRPDAGRKAMRRHAAAPTLPARRVRVPASTGSDYPLAPVDVAPARLTIAPAGASAAEPLRNSFGVHANRTDRTRRFRAGTSLAMGLLRTPAMLPPPAWRSLAARNALLASLSGDALRRWQSAVEHVRVTRGQILAAPGMRLPYVYFPLRGVVALVA